MTRATESRPDRARNALRAARPDRVRTRRRRATARRRTAGGGGGIRRRGPRGARDDGCGVGGDGCRAACPAARPVAGHRRRRPGAPTVVEACECAGAQRFWRLRRCWRSGSARSASGTHCGRRPPTSTAEQVFAAPDVRTVSGPIPSGGTATLVFSHEKDAGVLVMNNVPPPKPGTVYQMWLVGDRVREVGRDDGRQGGRAVDHCGAAGSRRPRGRWPSPSSRAADPSSRRARCSPNCPWSDGHSRVAVAASARTSAMSCRRCHARRCRIAPLPCSAMRASSARTMS